MAADLDYDTDLLQFGVLGLLHETPTGEQFTLDGRADLEIGEAEPLRQSIPSQLFAGELVRNGPTPNRTLILRVKVTAADPDARSRGGTALALESQKRELTFTWSPGRLTVPTQWRVLRSFVHHEFNLVHEIRGFRIYRLTMEVAPDGRSTTTVRDSAPVGGTGSDVQINSADALTGWTPGENTQALVRDTVTKTEGTASVRFAGASSRFVQYPGYQVHTAFSEAILSGLNLTGHADRPFVYAMIFVGNAGSYSHQAWANDFELRFVGSRASVVSGGWWVLACWQVPPTFAAIATLRFRSTVRFSVSDGESPGDVTPRIDNLRRAGQMPAVGARETMRTVTVRGSARSDGSLEVVNPTAGLGRVILFTHPDLKVGGYEPALMNYTPNAAVAAYLSGRQPTLQPIQQGGQAVYYIFTIPAASLPRGDHQLAIYGDLPQAVIAIDITTSLKAGTVTLATSTRRVPRPPNVPTSSGTGGPVFFTVGSTVTLPDADIPPGSDAAVEIVLNGRDVNGSAIALGVVQQAWSFHQHPDATLHVVDCGTVGTPTRGTANNRLWIDAPNVDNGGIPGLFIGTKADRTDRYSATQVAQLWGGAPVLNPGENLIYLAAVGGAGLLVDLVSQPAWIGLAQKLTP